MPKRTVFEKAEASALREGVTRAVLGEVLVERRRQDGIFGDQGKLPHLDPVLLRRGAHPQRHAEELEIPGAARAKFLCGKRAVSFGAMLVEEVAEAVEAAALKDKKQYRAELVQVAAVAVLAIEALDRE